MNPDHSHRFAITGCDPDHCNRTLILWRDTDLIRGQVVRRVVLTLDATRRTAVILTPGQAIELAAALRAAADSHGDKIRQVY